MSANIFSVLMTVLWSSVLIIFFSLLRTRTRLLHICSISTVILLYLFCAVRLVLPFELPWTHVIAGGRIYNAIHKMLVYKINDIRICELLFGLWIIGMLFQLVRYFTRHHKAMNYFREMPQEKSLAGQEIMDEVDRSKRIQVLKTTGLRTPCCVGIFRKRIFLPDKVYDRDELRYILLHEYAHLDNGDILLKLLITILCGIYWWNPLVYLLRKDLSQSMEIRCDLSVVRLLKEKERADYLAVMLKTFCEDRLPEKYVGAAGLVDNYSQSLLERFQIVADMKIMPKKQVNLFAGAMILVILAASYSFILQSEYEAPVSDIETDRNIYMIDEESSYIIKRGNTYILHTADTEVTIDEDTVRMLLKRGFIVKEVSD